ncbi:MaoC/PaaZ C-terminal domain-containing protein [Bogoriella caseilytica]|uniref:Acyl dehydratase n=1 Tax=Bogoriella caseilytica TaxID=56055 RepID=A0A3N2BE19_9MICO|nr:MaoC/PaaZ C-terminal domain-containing protein [Bogoriella caseilytica]ROR73503.1 acyl dehydratase [Bogoriella caseilytica]
MSAPALSSLETGQELFSRTVEVDRERLVRYAGASGDRNPIHYDAAFAESVGLPGVIAHGMLTMGLGASAVAEWAGDPGAVIDYGVRFTRPVQVPPTPGSAEVQIAGTAGPVDSAAGTVRVDLTVTSAGVTVLAKARATVRLG